VRDPFESADLSLPRLEGHVVRRVPGYRAEKRYVCPECQNAVPAGQGHVVAWPEHLPEDRRHWHLHCWRVAANRGRIA
jgi:hypothetical protein